jgi:putative membrane protein
VRNLILRWAINALALFITVQLVPGLHFTGTVPQLFGVAAVFGILNAVLRPILAVLTCPLMMLTLGLFALVLNGAMLKLTAVLAADWGFRVDGWLPAIIGGLLIGIVSFLAAVIIPEPKGD